MGSDSDLSGWKNLKKVNCCFWQSAEDWSQSLRKEAALFSGGTALTQSFLCFNFIIFCSRGSPESTQKGKFLGV